MALNINPSIGGPLVNNDSSANKGVSPNGLPNADAANQLADLLKNPGQAAEQKPQNSPFGSPFSSARSNAEKPATDGKPMPQESLAQQTPQSAPQTKLTNPNEGQKTPEQTQASSKPMPQESLAQQATPGTQATQQPPQSAPQTKLVNPNEGQQFVGQNQGAALNQAGGSQAIPRGASSASMDIKTSIKSDELKLSDAQLSAAASLQNPAVVSAPMGVQTAAVEETATQPRVDGEKIQAMMNSVTKELGMRDLSQLKLGGEMTLKLDQGALPNTEVKVRFEGNEMVISIDSKTADVNRFCTDNLALLQQSVASGMKEEMKVRVEIRNQPDQPNQRKDEQGSGGSGGGNNSGRGDQGSQQSQSRQYTSEQEGDSLPS